MEKILDKISSYNILNNLLPGVVYCYLLDFLCEVVLINGGIIENIFLYYFIGMIISRIGSTIIEPFFRKIKFIAFAPYSLYVEAEKEDKKIAELSEGNNIYRTMMAMCVVILISLFVVLLCRKYTSFRIAWKYVMIGIWIILFGLSYKKQTRYIKKRIENCFKEENTK